MGDYLTGIEQEGLDRVQFDRYTEWRVVSVINPRIEIREGRPKPGRPVECKDYDIVYRPKEYTFEGACKNFDWQRMKCVYCNACPMSNAYKRIPFDVRSNCDNIMGW